MRFCHRVPAEFRVATSFCKVSLLTAFAIWMAFCGCLVGLWCVVFLG